MQSICVVLLKLHKIKNTFNPSNVNRRLHGHWMYRDILNHYVQHEVFVSGRSSLI